MAQDESNLRIRRTQKLLREAVIDLIEERDFDSLTVGEITQRAMVSRAAFYRNYQDKYDLVERIFDEAMQTLLGAVENPGPEHPPELWVKFFEHIEEYRRLYRALLGKKGSSWFVMKMRASLTEMIKLHACTANLASRVDPRIFADGFVPVVLSGLYVDTIIWWLEQEGSLYSPREIATRSALFAASIFSAARTLG